MPSERKTFCICIPNHHSPEHRLAHHPIQRTNGGNKKRSSGKNLDVGQPVPMSTASAVRFIHRVSVYY